MSTKTLLKRLALGTVVAVAAGTLSIVTTTSAHATSGTAGDFAAVAGTGVLSSSNISVDATTAATVNLLSTGSLVVTASAAGGYYTVASGGAIVASTASTGGGAAGPSTISASQSSVTTTAGTSTSATFTVNPTGVAGSTFQINGYTDNTKSTLTSVMTVTINGASVYGVPSVAKSYVSWVSATTSAVATTDTANANSTTTGLKLQAVIDLNDAYGNPVTTAGALTATVSSGANVALTGGGASPGNSAGSYTTAVYAGAPTNGSGAYGVLVTITEATAGSGWNGTLTVSYNGTVIGTKSGTISGVVSKLTVTPTIVVHTNTQNYGAFTYQAYDAAGNIVVLPYASLALSSSDNTAAVTAIAGQTANSSTAAGDGSITGGTTAGTSNVVLKYTNTLGTVISSNSFKVVVGGAAASYTAKLDKSSYNQGDIATLTVKFLDSKGNPAASDSALYTVSGSAAPYLWNASIASPMLGQIGSTGSFSTSTATVVSTYPANEAAYYQAYAGVVPDTTGSITIKYTVGSTGTFSAGNYNTVVDFPSVDAVAGSAQTVAYTVGSQGTSLNDVLKGIVALIASINKQIAALAKLVAPKKK
jgi:hypothetical protein